MGSPWASMENPRMSEIMDCNETHYSVRQNGGSTGSSSMRNMFPLHPVTSKRPESPYGAKFVFLPENPVFLFFCLLDPYWTPLEPRLFRLLGPLVYTKKAYAHGVL